MKVLFSFLLITICQLAVAQNPPAYAIYSSDGNMVTYDQVIESALASDVVFLGELHDNPISHWLQLRITKSLYAKKKKKLLLGAEMFESDNQLLINEYLDSTISEKNFEQEVRSWPNHKTDYKPLLDFAKDNELRFIATNIPRRYANLVYRKGLEGLKGLSDEAKSYIAPQPITVDLELSTYKSMLEMSMGHGGENLPKAQAAKDATMGHFIVTNRGKKDLFVHYNGAYHSDHKEGIVWYVEHYAPGTKVVTLTTVSQEDISSLAEDNKGKADYIICVPDDMTSTY